MENEKIIAEKLLQGEAVKLSPLKPYTWASGWLSPIYCDNRVLLSNPIIRDFIKSELCAVIFEKFENTDVVAGVLSAGVPWGIMTADQLKYPFVYVRSKPKEHGLSNQIEGKLIEGQKVIVIEDLISTGKSSFEAIKALQAKNVSIIGLVSIFNYGFEISENLFKEANIPCYSLTNYLTLIEVAHQKGIISKENLITLEAWRKNPNSWGK